MKVLLMHRDRDFDPKQALCWNEQALVQDLELETLFQAMAGEDEFLHEIVRAALLANSRLDVETVLYRQAVLNDCLANEDAVRAMYDLTVEMHEKRRRSYLGVLSRYPASVLSNSVELLTMFAGALRKLRDFAEEHGPKFQSEGFTRLFSMLERELTDEYLARIDKHLKELRFDHGVLISGELGEGNEGRSYVLRQPPRRSPSWIRRLLGQGPAAYTFYIDDRDTTGARLLSELRDRGINLVANAVGQSADHVTGFFNSLRAELAFYVACLNLHRQLTTNGESVCFPEPRPSGTFVRHCDGLYDVCLALKLGRKVVPNTMSADGKQLVIITGANQGGKSTFLRSVGVAQVMMESGMFVGARQFSAELVNSLFTHYVREEDATMKSGKFDEELSRMNELVEHVRSGSMVLFNESFGATNEREGSEIATQITRALLEFGVRVVFVTHLFGFARGFFERAMKNALFLRAERTEEGTRTFRVIEGEPLETSYGEDLYNRIFRGEAPETEPGPSALDAQPESIG